MDDLRNPGETAWPDGTRPEEDAAAGSATGVFGVVAGPAAGSAPVEPDAAAAKIVPPPPLPTPALPPVAPPKPATAEVVQPVVHRVVVGGNAAGKASDYDELLNRLRAGSVSNAVPERKSATPPQGMAGAVTPVPSSEGLSQLLRTLNVEIPAPLSVPPVVPPPVEEKPAEMRKIEVQTIDLRGPLPDAGVGALLHPRLAEKLPEVAPEVKAAPVEPAQPEAPVGGFTARLRTGSAEALDHVRLGAAKGSDAPVMPVAPPLSAAPAPAPAASAPGSFTQMFQALDSKVEAAPVEASFAPATATPPARPASAPGSFTEMFRAVDAKAEKPPGGSGFTPVPVPPPAPAASAPGSFTQMFQALDAKVEAAPVEASFAPKATQPPASAAGAPGTFTQMFRALDAQPENAPTPPAAPVFPPATAVPPAAPASSAPGTFTQLFRTLDSGGSGPAVAPAARMEPAPVIPPKRDEGSFTQMLSTQRPPDVPREPQRAAPMPGAWEPAPSFGEPLSRAPEPRPEPVGGGLTQLLRTLDGPSTPRARRDESPAMPPPAAGPGMFTQAYQRLDQQDAGKGIAPPPPVQGVPAPFAPAATGFNLAAPPVVLPPAPNGGQSEFTRILDASRMREMGLRGGGAAPVAPAAQAVAPMATPQMAPPMPVMQLPQMPQAQMPGMPQGGGYPMPQPGMPGYAPPAMAAPQMAPPAMPAAPAVQTPNIAAPAPGMQKYLPVILIGVIFLLVVVVIALIFLMKR